MKLIKYVNSTFEEEKALYRPEFGTVLVKGDYYHDKIDEKIEGFIAGIEYMDDKVELEVIGVGTNDPLFNRIGFYNNEY